MFSLSKKIFDKAKAVSNFEQYEKFFYSLQIESGVIGNYINECIVSKYSMTGRVYTDGFTSGNDGFVYAGTGLHLVRLKCAYAIMRRVEGEKDSDRIKVHLLCLPWERDKILEELRSIVPIYPDYTRIDNISKNRHQVGSLNPKFGTAEQFVREADYRVVEDAFLSMVAGPETYEKRGKPFKETILLYGAPGTAKSTLIRHFASRFKLDMLIGTPSDIVRQSSRLTVHRNCRPLVVVMEDFDSSKYLTIAGNDSGTVAISAEEDDYGIFINLLNGTEDLDNVIIIMTTNYIDRIIPSVIRGGRVNRKVELKPLTPSEIGDFLPGEFKELASSYSQGELTVTMIPDLREATNEAEFREMVKILS